MGWMMGWMRCGSRDDGGGGDKQIGWFGFDAIRVEEMEWN